MWLLWLELELSWLSGVTELDLRTDFVLLCCVLEVCPPSLGELKSKILLACYLALSIRECSVGVMH